MVTTDPDQLHAPNQTPEVHFHKSAVSQPMRHVHLFKLVDEISNDDDIRAFVITAEGTTNFSVGTNLKELSPGHTVRH